MRSVKRTLLSSLGAGVLFVLAGCGGGGGSVNALGPGGGGGGGTNPTGASIYVIGDFLYGEVFQFPQTATGSATPSAIVAGGPYDNYFPGGDGFDGLAVDAAGNIYVGDQTETYYQILVYPPGSSVQPPGPSGTSNPSAKIIPQIPPPEYPFLELDKAGNVYLDFSPIGEILVFSPTGKGNYVQSRVISGTATTLYGAGQMAIDSANNLYVANGPDSTGSHGPVSPNSTILIFNSTANGNVAPTGTISGSNTMFETIDGLALDSAGNIYVAADAPGSTPGNAPISILEFSAGSTGNVAPIRTIGGSATGLNTGSTFHGLRVDGAGNIYYLIGSLSGSKILKFAPNASGNAAPIAEIDDNANVPNDSYWEYFAVN